MIRALPISALCFLLSAFASAAEYSVTIFFDRNPEPDVIGYRLHHGPTSRGYVQTVDIGNNTFGSLTVTGLTYIAVTAYNDGAESGYSSEVVFTPTNATPGVASALYVAGIERVTLLATSAPSASAVAVPGFRAWAEIVDINNPANRSKLYAFAPDGGSAYIRFGHDGRTNDVPKSFAFVTTPRKAISIVPPVPAKKKTATTAGSKKGKL